MSQLKVGEKCHRDPAFSSAAAAAAATAPIPILCCILKRHFLLNIFSQIAACDSDVFVILHDKVQLELR
jgi:hypothetical protein